MALIAKNKGGGGFELVPEDQHVARCVRVIDIGTQSSDYGPKHQCIICWELPEQMQTFDAEVGPEPCLMSKFYTLSLSEKSNLRGMLESWRGRSFTEEELEGFDLKNLVGVACLLQVIHKLNAKKELRAEIGNVAKLPKGMQCPKQILPSLIFELDASGQREFDLIPAWQQEKVKAAAEYKSFLARLAGVPAESADGVQGEPFSDEVPF